MVSIRLKPYRLQSCGLSDIGLVRQNNEDIWAQLPEDSFFLLADGMGGHQAGEVAARETSSVLCKIVQKKITPIIDTLSLPEIKDLLDRAIRHVNVLVFKMSRTQSNLKGMGTTLCCLLFRGEHLIFAHVGDSRIYRFRNRKLKQLTKDHSLLMELVDQGQLDERQATEFIYKNIITKAIGTEPKVDPAIDIAEIEEDDLYLMCSDGLSDLVSLKEMEEVLIASATIQQATKRLVAWANEKGGRDNITVVIAKVKGNNDASNIS